MKPNKAVLIIGFLVLILVLVTNYKREHPGQSIYEIAYPAIDWLIEFNKGPKNPEPEKIFPVTAFVTIPEEGFTEEIVINDKAVSGRFRVLVDSLGTSTPFTAHYNGGAIKGGFDDHIPSKEIKDGGSWSPKFNHNATTVSFSVPKGSPSIRISYTIAPIKN